LNDQFSQLIDGSAALVRQLPHPHERRTIRDTCRIIPKVFGMILIGLSVRSGYCCRPLGAVRDGKVSSNCRWPWAFTQYVDKSGRSRSKLSGEFELAHRSKFNPGTCTFLSLHTSDGDIRAARGYWQHWLGDLTILARGATTNSQAKNIRSLEEQAVEGILRHRE